MSDCNSVSQIFLPWENFGAFLPAHTLPAFEFCVRKGAEILSSLYQFFEQKVYQIINYKIPETLLWGFDISVPRAASGYCCIFHGAGRWAVHHYEAKREHIWLILNLFYIFELCGIGH